VIPRASHLDRIRGLLDQSPVVAILGARQVGKTTLAREILATRAEPGIRYDLEDPRDLQRLAEPTLELEGRSGLVVLDEIQRRPDLFPILRVLVDRPSPSVRFLVLGSASPELLRQSSETLAGRIAFHEQGGFDLDEVGVDRAETLWLRGGFPRSFLAADEDESVRWRRDFVRTFVERDLPQLGFGGAPETVGRFWKMLAHYHGQTWNSSEFARSFGVSESTVRRYLATLEASFMVRRLAPWRENVRKRQVKSPKVYLADSGLLHTLLDVEDAEELSAHPKVGASWEGFALDTIVTHLGARRDECHFWGSHGGAELDLLIVRGPRRYGFELKRTDAPRSTRSMHAAMETLGLDHLDVVHAGRETFQLHGRIRALALRDVLGTLGPLR
jgi:hypothetical protein